VVTARYYVQLAGDLRNRHPAASERFLRLAGRTAEAVLAGRDPLADARGVVVRGYRSPLSTRLQGYSVFLSRGFDPSVAHPMAVLLHGGSSNHHLFLNVVLGNNVPWATYTANLWTTYEPRWDPGEFVLLAANGFGQVMWRWMGEHDVLSAIEDAGRAYRIDPDRIFLNGISNGGVGTYTIGFRHAWRFAGVLPMAGAPSWKQYASAPLRSYERILLEAVSAMDLAVNGSNTFLRFFHGDLDGGPMKPEFVLAFERQLQASEVPHVFTRYGDLGHDIIYPVHRRGRLFEELAPVRRNRRPTRIRLASADFRAARQHWVEVAAFADYPVMARVEAEVTSGEEGGRVEIATENVRRLRLYAEDIPVPAGGAELRVDGTIVLRLPEHPAAVPLVLARGEAGWAPAPYGPEPGVRKVPGLSGPLTDAFVEPVIHVYGADDADETEEMRAAAVRAMHNWTLWIWDHDQPLRADTELTEAEIRDSSLVIFGTVHNSSLLRRIAPDLPIGLTEEGIRVGDRVFAGPDAGVRFIAPNPLNPSRYVVVQAGNTAEAAVAGNALPDFLPDFVVYDRGTTADRERLVSRRRAPLAAGFFDVEWRPRPDAGKPPGEPTR
jgi:predicted esterase